MGRKTSGAGIDEAFDLFLDTITNAFGGIVFIALLVCVLLQLSGPAQKIRAAAAQRDQEKAELARLMQEIQTYERLIAQNQELLNQLRSSQDPVLLRKFADLKKRLAMFDMYKSELGQTDRVQETNLEELARLKQELYDLQQKQPILDQKLRELKNRSQELSRSRTEVGGSGAADTKKTQVPILIMGGTMTFLMNYDAKGNATGLNTIGVEETSKSALIRTFKPRVEAGTAIQDTDRFRQQLQNRLAGFDKNTTYMGFVVWPDSYEQYELLRKETSRMGYGYYLVLMKANEAVSTGGPAKEYRPK